MKTPKPNRLREAGQSLTVAIIVLFLLLFLGGLFIAIVINNLRGAQTTAVGVASDKFAEAGRNYLSEQLTNSPEGADWRPIPDLSTNTLDPDFEWLRPCADIDSNGLPDEEPCGYTRINFGGPTPSQGNLGGRALVKISYDPIKADPTRPDYDRNAKYIRLDSVGRAGIVVSDDPTTFRNSDAKGQRRETFAYKAIGINEYLRYFTNRDNRPNPIALGAINPVRDTPAAAPGATRPIGAPAVREIESVYYGGSIRSNAPITLYGVNRFFLDPRQNDGIEVAGPIRLNGVDDTVVTQQPTDTSRIFITDLSSNVTSPLLPSGSNAFSTLGGLVRDNPSGSDVGPQQLASGASNLRMVGRTSVPVIDAPVGGNGLTRYRLLTRNSEPMDTRLTVQNPVDTNNLGADTPGLIGWGSGMYINNRDDIQQASSLLFNAYSLRSDWLNPGVNTNYWRGENRYVPPAVVITLTPRYMIIQRSATSTGRSYFRNPLGQRLGTTATIIRYSGLGTGAADTKPVAGLPPEGTNIYKYEGYPAVPDASVANLYRGEFAVFAEGNVRIRGTLGGLDPETRRYFLRHLTVVSNGTIYVDGSLLRDNIPSDAVDGAAIAARGRSSIALLAKQYVTVNTTQFLTPSDVAIQPEVEGSNVGSIRLNSRPGSNRFDFRLTTAPVDTFGANGQITQSNITPNYLDPASNNPVTPNLFLRHSAAGTDGSAAVRLNVNIVDTIGNPNSYLFPPLNLATLALGGPTSQEPSVYFNDAFPLNVAQLYPASPLPFTAPTPFAMDNRLTLEYDASAGLTNMTDYRLSRFGVAPLDIRIEALVYAQEGSFFIIPGPWMNPDPNDTYERYVMPNPNGNTTARFARSGDNLPATRRVNPRYPFHGEPMDIRITFFGAITENLPAEIGDQGAWLEKWGWVPNYYGSTGLPDGASNGPVNSPPQTTIHSAAGTLPGPRPAGNGGGSGILYVYDNRMAYPYFAGVPLRTDSYGRTLPVAPRLPVAPGLIFAGENTQY